MIFPAAPIKERMICDQYASVPMLHKKKMLTICS